MILICLLLLLKKGEEIKENDADVIDLLDIEEEVEIFVVDKK